MRTKVSLITMLAGLVSVLISVPVSQGFSGAGSGTQQGPYIITNVYELQEMNNDLDAWYELGNDIDASATEGWNMGAGFFPIGTDWNRPFTGHFEGKGHTITLLHIDRPQTCYTALFGFTDIYAEIKDVGLVDVDINGSGSVGGLVGFDGSSSASITKCYSTGSVRGQYQVGGLVGTNGCGTITSSYSAAEVSGSDHRIGGLVGHNTGYIANCYATGNVNGTASVGGLAGMNYGGMTNSYSTGNVAGTTEIGGLVGWNCSGTMTNCYSVGRLSGLSNVGGLVGVDTSVGLSNGCFWNIESSGQSTSAAGLGKTTAEMKQQSTFTDWDFATVWDIIEGQTYPFLRGFGLPELPPPENQPPNASFTFSPGMPDSGEHVTFDASGSSDPEGESLTYEWDFGDGETAEGQIVSHQFRGMPDDSAIYTVKLTVKDTAGQVGTDEELITVTHLEKQAEVVVDDILGTGLSRIGARTSYNWDRSENGKDVFKISRIESWSNYFVGVYVVSVENQSGVLWQKRLPAIPLDRTYYPDNLYVHASDWLRVTAYGVTEKEMLGLVSIASGLVGLPTMPPGDVPFFYGSDTVYFAPDYIDTSDYPPIDVEDMEILPFLMGRLCSPGELRVCDSQGHITGLVNGQIKEEIPESAYFDGNFIIASPLDSYLYKVVGTDAAVYDLAVISVGTQALNAFAATEIPTAPGVLHEYIVNWSALANGQKGVTLEVDADGDGTFEQTISAGATLQVAVCVDDYTDVVLGRVAYDRRTGQFSVDTKVTNSSATVIGSPVWLVIESISNPAVTLAASDGTTIDGKPYVDLSGLLGNGQLDPTETISKRIYFNNPNRVQFTFKPSVRGVILP